MAAIDERTERFEVIVMTLRSRGGTKLASVKNDNC